MIDDRCPCCGKIVESNGNPFGVGYCGCDPGCSYCVWCCPKRISHEPPDSKRHDKYCPKVSGMYLDGS